MKSLESIFISGSKIYTLSKDGDKLQLRAEEYSGLDDIIGVKRSFQPDMLIPSVEATNFAVEVNGEFIVLKPFSRNEINHMIRAATIDDYTCFFIDTDKKLLVHVQPKTVDYNFDKYEYKPIVSKTVAELERDILEMHKQEQDILKNLVDSLEELDKAESKVNNN
jgi:hypothetical protein